MKLTQISIFLENRKGRLATISHILGDEKINILALSLADTNDFGILRIIVENLDKATQILKNQGFAFTQTSVAAIHVPEDAGSLSSLLEYIDQYDLNIEYMYAMRDPINGGNALVFRFEDIDTAIEKLLANGYSLLPKTLNNKH